MRQFLFSLVFMLGAALILSCSPVSFSNKSNKASGTSCEGAACATSTGPTYWTVGAWSACTKTCGGGTQSRSVVCVNSEVAPVSDTSCTESKPAALQSCNTQSCSGGSVDKVKTVFVEPTFNDVDILLVIDDSSSMANDNAKLASRLAEFVNELSTSAIDWQMCVTTTDVGYYEGRPIKWSNASSHILTKNSGNLSTIIQQTIYDIGSGFSNDEQGIKASSLAVGLNPSYTAATACMRSKAALAVILISDEDERSVGGNKSLSSAQYQPLDGLNQPSSFGYEVERVFNTSDFSKKKVFNSIVVKDAQCEQSQDSEGSPSFIGTKYIEVSKLTGGGVGSICDSNYSTHLKYFKDSLQSLLNEVDLECVPVGTPLINVPTGTTFKVEGSKVIFSPAIPQGINLTINYKCGV